MITPDFYLNYLSTYHTNYNGKILRSLNWCHEPKSVDNTYVEFIDRQHRPDIDLIFCSRFNNNIINIRIDYYYFGLFNEKKTVEFNLLDYKKNTYNNLTTDNNIVNFMADEEIITFINQFDDYCLEINDTPFTFEEYNLYSRHIMLHPELYKSHTSKYCDYNVSHYLEEGSLFIKFNYIDKTINESKLKEFRIFKNRAQGDTFHDIDNNVNYEIVQRYDEILYDFYTFMFFRLN